MSAWPDIDRVFQTAPICRARGYAVFTAVLILCEACRARQPKFSPGGVCPKREGDCDNGILRDGQGIRFAGVSALSTVSSRVLGRELFLAMRSMFCATALESGVSIAIWTPAPAAVARPSGRFRLPPRHRRLRAMRIQFRRSQCYC